MDVRRRNHSYWYNANPFRHSYDRIMRGSGRYDDNNEAPNIGRN